MSKLMDSICEKARKLNQHIVLPEGEEDRIVAAAKAIVERGIAKVTLLGRKEIILENRDVLERSANLLIEKEKIGREEFEALFES